MNTDEIEIEYFKEAVLFFKEFQWIYNKPVTQILFQDSLNKFPIDWLKALEQLDNNELNEFVTKGNFKTNWPASLINFVIKCRNLNKLPNPITSLTCINLPEAFTKKLSIKKQHEIFHLAKLVHEQCLLQNIELIVDLGAGLGYICQLLNYLYSYKVLGLESNAQNVETAKSRQKKLFPDSLLSVKYVCSNINIDSSKSIELILQQEFNQTENICLMGLHACGDLSVYMSKIFLEMIGAQLLILESCCYHRLSLADTREVPKDDEKEYFSYYPLSKILKDSINLVHVDVGKFFRRPFMRLACQETSDRWLTMHEQDHDKHAFHVLARAVLELFGVRNGLHLKKLVRKATRKSQCINFENYLNDCVSRYVYEKKIISKDNVLISAVSWDSELKSKIMQVWEDEKCKKKSVELYTALQLLLQNAAESLVLIDRLCYLKEYNCEVNIIPTMNRSLSPRNCAMISRKNQSHCNL